MVSLEQVRALESRVEKAVSYIAALRTENAELRRRVEDEQSFIDAAAAELETAESARAAAESRAAALERSLAETEARVAETEARASELAGRIEEYKRDQGRIEEGIVHALEKLDSFEDLILGQTASHIDAETARPEVPRRAEVPESGIETVARPETESPRAEELAPQSRVERAADAPSGESPERPAPDSQLDIF